MVLLEIITLSYAYDDKIIKTGAIFKAQCVCMVVKQLPKNPLYLPTPLLDETLF